MEVYSYLMATDVADSVAEHSDVCWYGAMWAMAKGRSPLTLADDVKRDVRNMLRETPSNKSAFWIWAQDVEAGI